MSQPPVPQQRSPGMFSCPACDLPATVEYGALIGTSRGLVEHVRVTCAARHSFLMPVDELHRRVAAAPRRAGAAAVPAQRTRSAS